MRKGVLVACCALLLLPAALLAQTPEVETPGVQASEVQAPAAPEQLAPGPTAPAQAAPRPAEPGRREAPPRRFTLPPPLPRFERFELGGGRPLLFNDVWLSVERHYPAIVAAQERLRSAQGEQLAAQGGFDVQLKAKGWGAPVGYYDWARADVTLEQPTPLWGTSVFAGWRVGRGGDIPTYYGQYETLDAGEIRLGLRVPLWRDGPIDRRRARITLSDQAVVGREAAVTTRRLKTRIDVAKAYFGWVAAGRKAAVVQSLLDLALTRDDQIRRRVRAGALAPIDVLENRRVILSRETSMVGARRAFEQAAILLSLFYRDRAGEPQVASTGRVPAELAPPGSPDLPLAVALQRAVEQRPEMAEFQAALARQDVSVELAENQLAPRIDLSVAGSLDVGNGSELEQQVLGRPVLEGGLLFSMPLQLREGQGGIQRERAALAALQSDAQLARDRVHTEVRDAYSALTAAVERLTLASESAEVATTVADAERIRFRQGASDLFTLNLREQAAAAAQAVQVDAEAKLYVAHAMRQVAIGDLPPAPP